MPIDKLPHHFRQIKDKTLPLVNKLNDVTIDRSQIFKNAIIRPSKITRWGFG